MPQKLSSEHIDLQPYIARLNLQNAQFVRIAHDDALVAPVYRVTTAAGETYILKICTNPRHYHHEVFFLNHFAGRIPVPQIIQVVPPEKDLAGAILMECLAGDILSAQHITDHIAYELGVSLATVHAERLAQYGDIVGGRQYLDAHTYIDQKFQEAFAECAAHSCLSHLPEELLAKSRQYYDAHVGQLSSVDGPCLVHRDFRPANIMVHTDELQGIIDWSSSRSGFAEEDFIPLYSGQWHLSPESKKKFLAGYGAIRPVPDYQAMMPLLQLVRAFYTLGYTIKSGAWQGSGTRAYQDSLQAINRVVYSL